MPNDIMSDHSDFVDSKMAAAAVLRLDHHPAVTLAVLFFLVFFFVSFTGAACGCEAAVAPPAAFLAFSFSRLNCMSANNCKNGWS